MDIDASGGNNVVLGVGSNKGTNTPGWILASLTPLTSPWSRGVLVLVLLVAALCSGLARRANRWHPTLTRQRAG